MSLRACDIGFAYPGGPAVLRGCSLTVAAGECVALTGPSGVGKSTLAKILTGYLRAQVGEVLIDSDLPKRSRDARRRVGRARTAQLIWQHPEEALDPRLRLWRSIDEGLAGGAPRASDCRLMRGRDGTIERLRATGELERLGVRDAWLDRWPHELSIGQLMRCCIVRALLARPRYLVCDEMTAMVDALTQAQIWHALLETAAEREMGVVVITHAPALARRLCEHEVALDGRSNGAGDILKR